MNDVAVVRRKLEDLGWVFLRRTRHGWLYASPNFKRRIVIPTTPSDHRWKKNLIHDLFKVC